MADKSSYDTTSGLLDDFDCEITSARFAVIPDYNPDTLLLIWETTTNDPDVPEYQISFPMGSGWETMDGGKTATHERGKTQFTGSSWMGMLINRCVKVLGIRDLLQSRGEATEAHIWEGLRFHLNSEEVDYGGEIGTRSRLLPTEFLGEGGTAQPVSRSAAPTATAADNGEMDPRKLKALVTVMAKRSTDHATFMDAVLDKYPQIAEAPELEELFADVLDPEGLFAK